MNHCLLLSASSLVCFSLSLYSCDKKIDYDGKPENSTESDPDFHLHSRDIVLNEEQKAYYDSDLNLAGAALPVTLWPKGVMPYSFKPGYPSSHVKVTLQAIDNLNKKIGVLIRPAVASDKNIVVFDHQNQSGGCWSNLGLNQLVRAQTISIDQKCGKVGIVMHEIFHAFGFHHEQVRFDRDQHLQVFIDRVDPSQVHNFNKIKAPPSFEVPAYDIHSLMHYPSCFFRKAKACAVNTATILTKASKLIPYADHVLQNSDILGLLQLYAPEFGRTRIVGFKRAYADILRRPKLTSADQSYVSSLLRQDKTIKDLRWGLASDLAVQAQIKKVYQEVFGGAASKMGINTMQGNLMNGGRYDTLKADFVMSAYMKQKISEVYHQGLGRKAGPNEEKNHITGLSKALQFSSILPGLLKSPEFKSKLSGIYVRYVDRPVNVDETSDAKTKISKGQSFLQIKQALLDGPEILKSIGEFQARVIPGQEPLSDKDFASWKNKLKGNLKTLKDLKNEFIEGDLVAQQVEKTYKAYVEAEPEEADLRNWRDDLLGGQSSIDLRIELIRSPVVKGKISRFYKQIRTESPSDDELEFMITELAKDPDSSVESFRFALIEDIETKLKMSERSVEELGADLDYNSYSKGVQDLKDGKDLGSLEFAKQKE